MLGALVHLGEEEIDRVVERVLNNKRVEMIARKITELLLEQLTEGLKARDKEE